MGNDNHFGPSFGVNDFSCTGGVYHCEPCGFAAHYRTVGIGPCPYCKNVVAMKIAKWNKEERRWVFKEGIYKND